MLTTHQEIKAYVIKTIRGGDKPRIQKVMARYVEWLKENKVIKYGDATYELAKRIFTP